MQLNPKQLEDVIEYLKTWKTAECAICGFDDWAVSAVVFGLPEYVSGGSSHWNQVFPVVPLTCKTCGNVLLVSAIAAGIVKAPVQT